MIRKPVTSGKANNNNKKACQTQLSELVNRIYFGQTQTSFFQGWAKPLRLIKESLNTRAYNGISNNMHFQPCGNSLGKALSCFNMTCKTSSIKKLFVQVAVEELEMALNTIQHLLDDLEG